ncbi:ankyrin repeat domain-containing protein 61-like [Haliotis rubra]|uniref:ankyrin repeat domain-containing protein 61-like n=1 Tax=Haliotis rubra TaxID=36100 RepID=UPI001EE5B66A|nr:ankyrin repeat domain-containing protein 61-like [Haliotis rubra]
MDEGDPQVLTGQIGELREAVHLNDVAKTLQWFESHHSIITGLPKASEKVLNKLVYVVIEAVQQNRADVFGSMLKYLFPSMTPSDTEQTNQQLHLLVHALLADGSLSCLKIFLRHGYDVNDIDPGGMTMLLYLAYKKGISRVKDYKEKLHFLVSQGADVNKEGKRSWALAPLHTAVLYNSGEVLLRLLIESGAKVNLQTSHSLCTPLYFAVDRGMPNIVNILLENGADPSIGDVLGDTPVHMAAVRHSKGDEMLRVLVKWNAPMNTVDSRGRTPLLWALSNWKAVGTRRLMLLMQAGCRCDGITLTRFRDQTAVKPKYRLRLSRLEELFEMYLFQPRSLQDITCFRVRDILGRRLPELVLRLPIPDPIKRRVQLEHYFGKLE